MTIIDCAGTADIVLNGTAAFGYTKCYRDVGPRVHGVAKIASPVFLDPHILKNQTVYMAEYSKHLLAMNQISLLCDLLSQFRE